MSKATNPADSATRVKAFRERLAGSSYRRVEAYVSTEEKAQLDSVKEELGVTSDVAIAGLLRMGLEAYVSSKATTSAKPAPVAYAQASSMLSNASGAALDLCGSLQEHSLRSSAIGGALSAPVAPLAETTNQPNPIAQFFKSRKETKNA
ncbi:hypothetical protein [Burkholderia cenocepacia]|uniref:hypothetical protein n=1 Tax=Burkholderia cenocepacia TaxID=95486 RepID=UPI00076C8C62|nr:hypothetical protein [Burkholderia cenocepacia]KWU24716.1 hypothetical protein AS149_31720 [Burkholderia cenocepacia]